MKMKITVREILFSTIIISGIFGLGILIDRSFIPRLTEKALKIVSAVQVDNLPSRFDYIRRTEVGDFMAAGVLEALDPVSISDIPGEYLEIKKVKEKYTKHVHHHTTSDGKGHTRSYTTVSYSWDRVDSWNWKSDSLLFMNQRFGIKEVNFHYSLQTNTTKYEKERKFGANVGDIRYVYTTWPDKTIGLMSGEARDKWYKGLVFEKDQTIEGKIKWAEKRIEVVPHVFWIFWILLILIAVFGFYWLENNWLEDKKKEDN